MNVSRFTLARWHTCSWNFSVDIVGAALEGLHPVSPPGKQCHQCPAHRRLARAARRGCNHLCLHRFSVCLFWCKVTTFVRQKQKIAFFLFLFSLIRTFGLRSKELRLGNKKNRNLFCIALDFSYLCRRKGNRVPEEHPDVRESGASPELFLQL